MDENLSDKPTEEGTGKQYTEEIAEGDEASDAGKMSDIKIFSVSVPKDAMDGAQKGLGNIVKGVLGGAAILIAAPYQATREGARTGGSYGALKGFGFGLGAGLVGCAAMTIGGAATGVMQIGRGIYNSPAAVTESMAGKDWDDDKKEWVIHHLKDESEILNMSEEDYIEFLDREAEEAAAAEVAAAASTNTADTASAVSGPDATSLEGISLEGSSRINGSPVEPKQQSENKTATQQKSQQNKSERKKHSKQVKEHEYYDILGNFLAPCNA